MRHSFTLLLVFSSIFPTLFAQEWELCRQVIGSYGGSAIVQGQHLSYTVGEPVIGTFTSTDFIVTQGFHQPELCVAVEVSTLDWDAAWQIVVHPNPTSAVLYVSWRGEGTPPHYHYSIYNLQGQVISPSANVDHGEQLLIDCRQWPVGQYYLQIGLPENDKIVHLPFILTQP